MKFSSSVDVYLWLGRCDMRCSFDRLAALVREQLKVSVIAGGVFLFFSGCRRKVKILYWDKDGYAIWHKRLEAGVFRVARISGQETQEIITSSELEELLAGVDFSRIKLRKNAEKGSYN